MSSVNTFSPVLRATAKKMLPEGVHRLLGSCVLCLAHWSRVMRLALLRRRMMNKIPGSLVRFKRYSVRINDGPNFYYLCKDIFENRIYHFDALRPDPLILDCGSNIGMSLLYYKQEYPSARVIAFEPEPVIFRYLQENIGTNQLADVRLVQAAVAGREGNLAFHSDGKYASYLVQDRSTPLPPGWTECRVPCVRLRSYLNEPVDFLKLNIEGAEWEAIADSEECLRQVREMVIEYHHLPGLPRTLHKILEMLNRQGFEYLINDFDSETNGGTQPPFRLAPDSQYFLLIYARRIGSG
jgi:FkbM family methyltransferase